MLVKSKFWRLVYVYVLEFVIPFFLLSIFITGVRWIKNIIELVKILLLGYPLAGEQDQFECPVNRSLKLRRESFFDLRHLE
jgi:hypothetical protein